MDTTVLSQAWKEFPPQQREALDRVAKEVCRLLPGCDITLSWGMPTFRIDGDQVLSLQGFSSHNSVFPGAEVIDELGSRLAGYAVTKGTIHFDRDVPMPARDIKAIVQARISGINASYPRASGEFKEFFSNGRLKARGRMSGDEMTGAWEWFRRDGTALRSGSFRRGKRSGTWTTYDRQGQSHKSTNFS